MYQPFGGDVYVDQPKPIKIGTCARWGVVSYDPVLHHYITERIAPSPTPTEYLFDDWIHGQFCLLGYNSK
jgi:hypothetical protein